jgi:type I site-specific restriction endonuclease
LALDVIADELGKDLDPFDLICHVAFDRKPLTRRERADNVQKRDVFAKYGEQARAVLRALLDKYADEGMLNLDDTNVLRIPPLNTLGTPVQLIKAFGGNGQLRTRRPRPAERTLSGSQEFMSVRTLVKSIQDIMRKDSGVDGDAQRISQLCWLFFLKIIDDQDQDWN